QHPRLTLDSFRFVPVAPTHALPFAATIVVTTQKRRRFGLDRHLQHVARESTDEPDHRWLRGCRRQLVPLQHSLDFFLQSHARWYSLHGVDLLRPRFQRSRSGLSHQEDTNASLLLQEV